MAVDCHFETVIDQGGTAIAVTYIQSRTHGRRGALFN